MNRKKWLSGSFWLIMAIHIVVFTSLGLLTSRGWGLLVIFLIGLGVLLCLVWLLRLYAARHPEKKGLAKFLSSVFR